jgi:phosphatidylinositol alpha-1,6-mannosyltransferase
VINNTFDARFKQCDRSAARTKYGLDEEFVLLIVGRMDGRERYKGHDRVIEALPKLTSRDGRRVVFLVSGDGNDRRRLENAAAAAGVSDRVRFVGEVLPASLPDLYRSADLFVMPSTGEGFGIVFLEAMACGTRALGLAAGGAPDALGDGELGILVDMEADFPAALQAAIQSVDRNREELCSIIQQRFGQAAFRQRVAQPIEMLQ